MIITESHDQYTVDQIFLQVVFSEATVTNPALARGEAAIWDTAATGLNLGSYVKRSGTAGNELIVAGIAEDTFAPADQTRVGLVQKFGRHDAVIFTANPAAIGRWFSTGTTAGKCTTWAGATPASATEAKAGIGFALQSTATTGVAFVQV